MAMVNMNSLLNGKDSRWLQLEVCREFQRNKCSRPDTECKFAHPPANVEVQNGRVTACYDSIKGRCNREKPPCKYFHPPQHLKDQLLINGRNHLALKNALLQQMGLTPGQPMVPGQLPTVSKMSSFSPTTSQAQLSAFTSQQSPLGLMTTTPYLTASMPQVGSTFSPYFSPGPLMPAMLPADPNNPLALVQQNAVAQQKIARTDRIEMDMKGVGSFYYENFAFPGMMPFKRAAGDKSGVPVYQPNAAYQQLLQPFVPVSCEYQIRASTPASALTGVNLNKHASTLPFYVRHNVPTSTPSLQSPPPIHNPTLSNQNLSNPTLHNPTLQNHSLPSLPSSVATSASYPSAAVMSNFQHFQHPFFSDLLAAQQQLSRFQAAHTITTPSVTGPTTVPAVLNNNNNNNNEDFMQPFKKIRRDV